MALSGAIAGIGGASQIGDFTHTLDGSPTGLQAAAFGYTGIVVAALARYNPFAVCLVAVLIGGLLNAGYTLQGPDFPSGLVGVMQGIILFCALGGGAAASLPACGSRERASRRSPVAEAGVVSVNDSLLVIVLAQAVLYGTPLLYAALGELLAERSGVLNLGVEGMMLFGAAIGFWMTQRVDGSGAAVLALAVVASALAGAAMAAIHAFLVITLRANQIVSGLALTIFAGGLGLSAYVGNGARARRSPGDAPVRRPRRARTRRPARARSDPLRSVRARVRILGSDAPRGRSTSVARAGDSTSALSARRLPRQTPWASTSRCIDTSTSSSAARSPVSQAPATASPSRRVGPRATRSSAGQGWIAIALVIFAFWRAELCLVGAYLFGALSALPFALQARDVDVTPELLYALPYVMTIVVLVLVSTGLSKRRLGAPAALGVPYVREER